MSLSVLVLDFSAWLSEYLQRSTLSSLRARSVFGLIFAERGALALRTQLPATWLGPPPDECPKLQTIWSCPAIRGSMVVMSKPVGVLPRRVSKPWGYEIWWALTDRYAGKILHVDAGHRLSLQFHERKDESCYVLTGKLLLIQGPSADELSERVVSVGEVWRNEPGQVHTIEAIEESDVLEVSTADLEDVIRLSDNYGREGTNAH